MAQLPDEASLTIRYEQLLNQPHTTLQEIADFLAVTPAFDLASVKPSPRKTEIQSVVLQALQAEEAKKIEEKLAAVE